MGRSLNKLVKHGLPLSKLQERISILLNKNFSSKEYKENKGNMLWNTEKKNINNIIYNIKKYLDSKSNSKKMHKLIALDHYLLRTCKTLSEFYIKANTYVPNPDTNFLQKIKPKDKNLAMISNEAFLDLIVSNDINNDDNISIFDILLDYCCTWEGHQGCNPSLDLYLVFQKTLLAKNDGILWLTFSTRATTSENVKHKVTSWIQKTADLFAYSLSLVYCKTYGTVVTFIYVTGNDNLLVNFSSIINSKNIENIETINIEKIKKIKKIKKSKLNIIHNKPKLNKGYVKKGYVKKYITKEINTKLKGYEIHKILNHRRRGLGYQYLIEWVGYSKEESTWEKKGQSLDKEALQLFIDYNNEHNL